MFEILDVKEIWKSYLFKFYKNNIVDTFDLLNFFPYLNYIGRDVGVKVDKWSYKSIYIYEYTLYILFIP